MDPWINLELWRERNKDLLREAEQRRLAQGLQKARRAERLEVRWSLPGDEHKIADLLERNGRPRWEAFEERFIVAEQKGKLLSALPYQTPVGFTPTSRTVGDRGTSERLVRTQRERSICVGRNTSGG